VTHTCPGIHRQTESFIFRAKKHFLVKDISLCAPTCERLYKRKAEDEQAQPEKRTGCELHIVCAARGIATKQWTILFDVNDRDAQRRKWSWSVLKIDLFQTQHGLMKFAKTGWRIAKRAKPAQRRNLEMFDTRCLRQKQKTTLCGEPFQTVKFSYEPEQHRAFVPWQFFRHVVQPAQVQDMLI